MTFRYRIRYVVEERREAVVTALHPDAALSVFNGILRNGPEWLEDNSTLIGRKVRTTLTYVDGTEA